MENKNEERKDPEFINEVVKEKKKSKRSLIVKALYVITVAAAAALVFGVVFAFAYHNASSVFSVTDESSGSVSIGSGEETEIDSSESSAVSSSSVEQAAEENNDEPQTVTEIIYETELTLDNYEQLYSQLNEIAQKSQTSLVTVTGITSQLDYFNESYENTQMNIGLIVAQSDTLFYILTYYDILQNATSIRVEFADDFSTSGTLIRADLNTGFAIISVDKSELSQEILDAASVASLGTSAAVSTGDLIIVIGNPNGYDDYIAYGNITSSSNNISLYDAEYRVFTTNVPVVDEGIGIVLDLSGRVIGITANTEDADGGSTMVALAISDIAELIEALSNNVPRAYAGIRGRDVTEQLNSETGIPVGVLVTAIAENSPAMMSGMMEYDIITAVDETEILSMEDFTDALNTYEPGASISVLVMRQVSGGYSPVELQLELGEI